MRLPKDPENWTPAHADEALARAWREFERYERRINFDLPQEERDAIYEPYRQARELAITVANHCGRWRRNAAQALP